MKKRKHLLMVGAILCLVAGFLSASIVRTQGEVTVTIDAPDEVAEGSDFVARVNITGVIDFDATNYDVNYDPTVLKVTSVTNGLIDGTTIPVDIWGLITPGTIRVVQNVPGLSGVSGSGYLAEIHLRVIGSAGETSDINLSNVILSDTYANEIPATWVRDSVQVYGLTPTPTPTPGDGGGGGGGGGNGNPSPANTPTPTPTPMLTPTPTPAPTTTPAVTIDILLDKGWNLFSFNVTPANSNVEAVLASIDGQYRFVETFDSVPLSFDPDLSSEENDLRALDPYHGYWIKMEEGSTLSITGTPVTATAPLPLQEGWNLVSYLADGSLPVTTALASIDGLYTAVLGYESEAVSFYPSLPPEMNTLEFLMPGYGYWIKMSTAATLAYSGSA